MDGVAAGPLPSPGGEAPVASEGCGVGSACATRTAAARKAVVEASSSSLPSERASGLGSGAAGDPSEAPGDAGAAEVTGLGSGVGVGLAPGGQGGSPGARGPRYSRPTTQPMPEPAALKTRSASSDGRAGARAAAADVETPTWSPGTRVRIDRQRLGERDDAWDGHRGGSRVAAPADSRSWRVMQGRPCCGRPWRWPAARPRRGPDRGTRRARAI